MGENTINSRSLIVTRLATPLLAVSFVGILLVITLVRIGQTPSAMYWDQGFLNYTFQDPYPIFEQGIPQFLIAGFVQIPGRLAEVPLNTILRSIAATFYLLSAGLLGWAVKGKGGFLNFFIFMLLIFTSGIQFLWLSSEPLAGAFLMLFFWGLLKNFPFGIEILFLVLFGLTKPDLFFVAILVSGCMSFMVKGQFRKKILCQYLFFSLILLALLPGLVQNGLGYLHADGRSLNSLGQHYAALIYPLQVTQGLPDAWQYYGIYVKPTWGMADGTAALILTNPARYMDFLFLSMATSLRRLSQGLLLFYLPLAIIVYKNWQDRNKKIIVLMVLTNLIPIFMLAFYHVRYNARFLPLALFTIFAGFDSVENPRLKWFIRGGILLLLVIQSILFIQAYSAGYWLVD